MSQLFNGAKLLNLLRGAGKVATSAKGVEAATGLGLDFIRRHPFAASTVGAATAKQGYEMIGKPIGQGIGRAFSGSPLNAAIEGEFAGQAAASAEYWRAERTRRKMAEAEARLAAADPALYTRVLAGRRLPKGAVVLGGTPRRDLMDDLTYMMAENQFGPPPVEGGMQGAM